MNPKPSDKISEQGLTLRFHLTDRSIRSFTQADDGEARKIRDGVDPGRLFVRPRIVIGSAHAKSVFVTAEIARVDFIQKDFQCWEFPPGYADIVELSEPEFRTYARLDQSAAMVRRDQPTPTGDLLVSFTQLQLRGGAMIFIMVEIHTTLPAESQSFMNFMLSKGSFHMRLRGGGISVVNLANLAAYTVYPGVAQIPADAWLAEPAAKPAPL